MDKFIKAQLDGIELSSQRIAEEARNIGLRIMAILGCCAGRESAVEYMLQQACSATPTFLNNSIVCNEYQEIVSQPKTIEEIIQEVKEMIIELKIQGSVRQRSNGLIEFRSNALGSIYGRTKEEIEQKLTEKLKEASKEKKIKKTAPLLSEFFKNDYLPYKVNQARSENTISGYNSHFKYIMAQGFNKPLTAYKSKEIEDFLYAIKETRKRQVLQGLFNNMFNRATTLGLIKSNPCATIEKMQHETKMGRAFSFVEMKEFFNGVIHDSNLTDIQKKYYIFVWLTGSRRNEALDVKKEDADFENKILTIHGTKTDGSDRDIPLTPLVEKLLKSIKIKDGYYFTLTSNQASNVAHSHFKKHKLHDLRHTFGTIQICTEKINPKTVSLWMGHSTIETTLRIYTHPEQLDKGTFLRGDLTEEEKNIIYRSKYKEILNIIEAYLG